MLETRQELIPRKVTVDTMNNRDLIRLIHHPDPVIAQLAAHVLGYRGYWDDATEAAAKRETRGKKITADA